MAGKGPESRRERSILSAQDHATGNGQIAVEPGAVERASVHLHGELAVPLTYHLGLRLDAQTGRIGVGPDETKAGLFGRLCAELEGRERGIAPHHVHAGARLEAPGRAFVEPHVAFGFESAHALRDGVKRRGGSVDIGEQV